MSETQMLQLCSLGREECFAQGAVVAGQRGGVLAQLAPSELAGQKPAVGQNARTTPGRTPEASLAS